MRTLVHVPLARLLIEHTVKVERAARAGVASDVKGRERAVGMRNRRKQGAARRVREAAS